MWKTQKITVWATSDTSTTSTCRTWKKRRFLSTSWTEVSTRRRANWWLICETSGFPTKSNFQICKGFEFEKIDQNRVSYSHLWNYKRYTIEWIGREGLDPDTHGEYLQHFITHFYKNMVKLIDRAMRKEDSSAQGQIVTEILQHLNACNSCVEVKKHPFFIHK